MKITSSCRRLSALQVIVAVLLLAGGATAARAEKYTLPQAVGDVALKDGTVLHGVTLVSVGDASFTAKWDGGRGTLPLAMLPDGMRADLVASGPVKAAAASITPGGPAGAPAMATPDLPTEIKLNNGFVLHDAKVAGWRLNEMTVDFVGGRYLVRYEEIVPEQRKIFVARKTELIAAYNRAAAARAAQAAASPNIPKGDKPPTPAELKGLIQSGIAAHLPVQGMTRQEVVEAVGMPDGVRYDKTRPELAYWLYRGKGKKADGTACDRILGFEKDILQGWKDQ